MGISQIPGALEFDDYVNKNQVLKSIQKSQGIFITFFEFVGNVDKQFILNLFACLLMLYLMNELSGQLSDFAADIAQSVSLSGITIPSSAKKLQQSIQKGAQNAKNRNSDANKHEDLNKRQGVIDNMKSKSGAAPKGLGGSGAAPKGLDSGGAAPKAPIK
jgi:hypothetical protein